MKILKNRTAMLSCFITILCVQLSLILPAQTTSPAISYSGYFSIGSDASATSDTLQQTIAFQYKTSTTIIASDTGYFIIWSAAPDNLLANVISDDSPPEQGYIYVDLINDKVYDVTEKTAFALQPRILMMLNDSVVYSDSVPCHRYADPADPNAPIYTCTGNKKSLTLLGFYAKENGFCVMSAKKNGMALSRKENAFSTTLPMIDRKALNAFKVVKARYLF